MPALEKGVPRLKPAVETTIRLLSLMEAASDLSQRLYLFLDNIDSLSDVFARILRQIATVFSMYNSDLLSPAKGELNKACEALAIVLRTAIRSGDQQYPASSAKIFYDEPDLLNWHEDEDELWLLYEEERMKGLCQFVNPGDAKLLLEVVSELSVKQAGKKLFEIAEDRDEQRRKAVAIMLVQYFKERRQRVMRLVPYEEIEIRGSDFFFGKAPKQDLSEVPAVYQLPGFLLEKSPERAYVFYLTLVIAQYYFNIPTELLQRIRGPKTSAEKEKESHESFIEELANIASIFSPDDEDWGAFLLGNLRDSEPCVTLATLEEELGKLRPFAERQCSLRLSEHTTLQQTGDAIEISYDKLPSLGLLERAEITRRLDILKDSIEFLQPRCAALQISSILPQEHNDTSNLSVKLDTKLCARLADLLAMRFPPALALTWTLQVANQLRRMVTEGSRRNFFGELSPSNLFVSRRGRLVFCPINECFAHHRYFSGRPERDLFKMCHEFSTSCRPPEMLREEKQDPSVEKAYVYQLGLVLVRLLGCAGLEDELNYDEQLEGVLDRIRIAKHSDEMVGIVRDCLCSDVPFRLQLSELIVRLENVIAAIPISE